MKEFTLNNIAELSLEKVDKTSLLDSISSKPFSGPFSYKLITIIDWVQEEILRYEKVRNNLLKKYGKEDESGSVVLDAKEDRESYIKFTKELKEVGDQKITYSKILFTQKEIDDQITVNNISVKEIKFLKLFSSDK